MEPPAEAHDVTEAGGAMFGPQGPGEIISRGLKRCVSDGATVFIVAAVALLPAAIAALFQQFVAAELGLLDLQEQMQAGQLRPEQLDLGAFILNGLYQCAAGVLMAVGAYFALAGAARSLADRALGRPTGPMGVFDALLGRLGRNLAGAALSLLMLGAVAMVLALPVGIAAGLIAGQSPGGGAEAGGSAQMVMQVIAMVLIVLPLLAFATYLVPLASITAIEDRGVVPAVGRSFGLVSGNFGRSFLVVVIASIIAVGPMMAVSLLMQQYGLPPLRESMGDSTGALVSGIPSTLAMLLLLPFLYSIEAVLYFDLRSRREDEDFTPADLALDMGYAAEGSAPGDLPPPGAVDPRAPVPPAEPPVGPEPPSEPGAAP